MGKEAGPPFIYEPDSDGATVKAHQHGRHEVEHLKTVLAFMERLVVPLKPAELRYPVTMCIVSGNPTSREWTARGRVASACYACTRRPRRRERCVDVTRSCMAMLHREKTP
jgi:hypothetical protein